MERHENTSVSVLNYHFVWIVRKRKKLLEGKFDRRVKELIRECCAAKGWEILALETDVDHVHLFVNCFPTEAPAKIVGFVKGYTSHALRIEFPWVKEKLSSLWTRSYYVGTAGAVSSETIKKYVESQKKI